MPVWQRYYIYSFPLQHFEVISDAPGLLSGSGPHASENHVMPLAAQIGHTAKLGEQMGKFNYYQLGVFLLSFCDSVVVTKYTYPVVKFKKGYYISPIISIILVQKLLHLNDKTAADFINSVHTDLTNTLRKMLKVINF